MDIKEEIIKVIQLYIKEKLDHAINAQDSIKEYSQSSELKQESKYDTRAIEAGYLKDAQALRIEELKASYEIINSFKPIESNIVISGSLVTIDIEGDTHEYFISPVMAPKAYKIKDKEVLIATVMSPLGQGLLNLEEGDDFELTLGGEDKIITLLKVD
jgi:transcription elongation GreA/GreB family factor